MQGLTVNLFLGFSYLIYCALLWRLLSFYHIENQLLTGGCFAFNHVLNAVCLNVLILDLDLSYLKKCKFGNFCRTDWTQKGSSKNWDLKRPQLCSTSHFITASNDHTFMVKVMLSHTNFMIAWPQWSDSDKYLWKGFKSE